MRISRVALPVAVTIFSFAGLLAILVGRALPVEAPGDEEETPVAVSAIGAARTPARTVRSTQSATAVRVVRTAGNAEALPGGTYRVTFTWLLEHAATDDPAVIRFAIGERTVSEQRGTLAANVFDASSGTFTIITSQECAAEGWSALLLSVRGQPTEGDATARARGVSCR